MILVYDKDKNWNKDGHVNKKRSKDKLSLEKKVWLFQTLGRPFSGSKVYRSLLLQSTNTLFARTLSGSPIGAWWWVTLFSLILILWHTSNRYNVLTSLPMTRFGLRSNTSSISPMCHVSRFIKKGMVYCKGFNECKL